ncbi:CLUMA_CG014779, isoform A [Clunio marinus]|uniref:CLUMA_CG014779, isoform A n=1 Tax=Clunio marinus TaxID=568069 RepID=A0A1J1IMC9_9DIPT|nr:CLUMA_CG014779, isoform A [Clunio marinus]
MVEACRTKTVTKTYLVDLDFVTPKEFKLFQRIVLFMKFLSVDDNAKGFHLWNGSRITISRNIKQKVDLIINYTDPLTT